MRWGIYPCRQAHMLGSIKDIYHLTEHPRTCNAPYGLVKYLSKLLSVPGTRRVRAGAGSGQRGGMPWAPPGGCRG